MGEVVDQVNGHFSVGILDGFSIFLENSIKRAEIGLGFLDLLVELANELTARQHVLRLLKHTIDSYLLHKHCCFRIG